MDASLTPMYQQMEIVEGPAPRIKPVNYLKHNRIYEGVGQTSVIAAEPAVVHFGGFTPGCTVRQVVHLRNISDTATRVHVVPPDSENFQVIHNRKPGSIAPGLDEQLIVEFNSEQLRYHYDCIRVQTQGGGLLIPLHAYPVMNEVALPKRLDLGRVALGESSIQELQLSCKVPLEFAFKVAIVKHNNKFSVSPLSGVVPANGTAAICITFTPTSLSTEELQLQVLISEFNAQPMPVTVTGSAMPGLAREQLLATAQQVLPPASNSYTAGIISNSGGGSIRGGAGGGDAFTVDQQHQFRGNCSNVHTTRQPGSLLPSLPGRQAGYPEVLLEGTYFPASLSSHHDVNTVLNQQPGKLRTKDIKSAIANRKRELEAEKQELEAVLAAGTAAGVDPLDQPSITPAIKEALFQLQLQQAEAGGRHCTGLVGSQGQVLGEAPPSPNTVKQLQAARQAMLEQHNKETEEAATHRLELEMQTAGALHVLHQPQQHQQQQPHSSSDSNGRIFLPSTAEHSQASSSSSGSYPGLEGFTPQWLLLESNEWRKRVQVTQRFVNAVRVAIYRNRAQTRLHKLKAIAARLRGNREGIAGLAVQEVVLESTVVQRPGLEPTQLLLPERVRMAPLPVYRQARYQSHAEVEEGQYGEFTMLQTQPFKAEFEYKLLGYAPEEYPGLIPYLPPCKDQPLMTGAGEESLAGLVCGLLPAGLTGPGIDSMPDGLACSPFVNLELGSRYSNEQVFAPLVPAWGVDAEALLQPRLYDFHDSAAIQLPGSSGSRALADAPLRAHSWLPLQNPWQAGWSSAREHGLMAGPDAAAANPHAAEDGDKPQVRIIPPSMEQIQRDCCTLVQGTDSQHLVQSHQDKLDRHKAMKREAAVQEVVRSAEEYNASLKRPHRTAIKP